ncbi:MAG: biopolymer transporter ExbD [Pseudomonadota bacterium]
MAFSMNTNRRAAMSEINVTPLVDVMLVLLIIFMVTAPMMQEGVSVKVPKADGEPLVAQQDAQPVYIGITPDGKISVDGTPAEMSNLVEKIQEARAKNAARGVRLKADTSVPYGIVIQIMAKLRKANIENLEIETAPEEEPAPPR